MLTLVGIILSVVVIYLAWIFHGRKRSKLPPGPPTLPIIGNLHLLGGQPHLSLTKLRKKYGDIYSFQFGSYPGVILNGSKVLREALSDNATNGRHKPTSPFPREGGIICSEDKAWLEQRKFAVKTLREMGFGKRSHESVIKQEVQELLEDFQKSIGEPREYHSCFHAVIINSLWVMITGQRFSQKDPELGNIMKLLISAASSDTFSALDALSFFVKLMKPFQKVSKMKRTVGSFMDASFQLFDKKIAEHQPEGKPVEEGGDFIDCWLHEIRQTTDPNSSFYGNNGIKNLRSTMFDLFLAGTETSSSTLTYTMMYLAQNPDIQEKVYQEIQTVVGKDRMPSLTDRPELTYTEAVILEVLRHTAIVPRSLIHRTTTTYKIQGFEIPPDTIVMPNLYSALYDEQVWGDPENFRPERFIMEDAEGNLTVNRHHESLLPFSFGKRICLGESLARDQLLLFVTSIFQKFKVVPAEMPLKIEYTFTPVVLLPVAKKLILQERM